MKKTFLILGVTILTLCGACKVDNDAGVDTDGALNGVFSVSDSTKVKFSRGNLQYQPSGTLWRFAEAQYDIIGNDNENIDNSYTGWIDLFGWGTSGWNSGAEAYMPYDTAAKYDKYIPGGDTSANLSGTYVNADWGQYNAIENGGNTPGQWRTLTKDEWKYLLNKRKGAGDKFGLAKVNNVDGLVILPDNWTLPDDVDFTAGLEKGYKTNRYSAVKWSKMQTAGAVFLPAAGYREGVSVFTKFTNYTECGFYWSSTHLSNINCNILFFGKETVNPTNFAKRHFGLSVRLVKDI